MTIEVNKKYIINNREYSHEDLATLAMAVACEKKAFRPTILDLRNLSGAFTEIFSIVSAANNRQVYSIAEEIRLFFKNAFNLLPVAVDGLESCTWVILDYGFMFIHIFQDPTREMYLLEQLWSKARNISVTEEESKLIYNEVMNYLKTFEPQAQEAFAST